MNTEAFRAQVRELLARRSSTHGADEPAKGATGTKSLCVPLRLSGSDDLAVLADLLRRVAASPALAAANAAGLLRFELIVAPEMSVISAASTAAMPAKASCCEDCANGKPCRCEVSSGSTSTAAAATPLLRGCITERDIKALPADCRLVGTAPRAVLTPLARDALRQRGIAVQPIKEA